MTDQQPHTPTTEQVRDGYSRKPPGHAVLKSRERQAAEFDRWLAARDARISAAAEQRGAIEELKQLLRELMEGEFQVGHHAGLHTASTITSARLVELLVSADKEGDDD